MTAPHHRYRCYQRIAVGVSVIDLANPAAAGFHHILARDGNGDPRGNLAAGLRPETVPAVGVVLVGGQAEYGRRGPPAGHRAGSDRLAA